MTAQQVEALGKLATSSGGWALGHPRRGLISKKTAIILESLGYVDIRNGGCRAYITEAGRMAYSQAMLR